MRTNSFRRLAALLLFTLHGFVAAQPPPASAPGEAASRPWLRPPPDYGGAQRLFDAYAARQVHLAPDPSLELIAARQLEPTAANVGAVQRLLATEVPVADKVMLIRILTSLYTRSDSTRRNAAIVATLTELATHRSREVASNALIFLATLGYRPGMVGLMDDGLAKGLIGEEEYCRELSSSFYGAPAAAQLAIVRRIAAKSTGHCGRFLRTLVGAPELARKLSPDTRKMLVDALRAREPQPPLALGHMGSSLFDYPEWLNSVAILAEASGEGAYAALVLATLNDPGTDPRKLLGFLGSSAGRRLMLQTGHRAPFAHAADKALEAADQFPGHPMMAPLAKEIRDTLAELPP